MREAVIVEAVRSPIARGKMIKGDLSGMHTAHLFSRIQRAVVERAGIEPKDVEQIIGGCVTQAGEQSNNITRQSWPRGRRLDLRWHDDRYPVRIGQQANSLINALVKGGSIDVGIGCGIEMMSHVGLGQNVINGPGYFIPEGWPWDSPQTQFEMAQRIAENRGISRETQMPSPFRPAEGGAAQAEGRFEREIVPVEALSSARTASRPGHGEGRARSGHPRDEREGLAALNSVLPDTIHTAGNSSQISDGAAAVLIMTRRRRNSTG